MRRQTVHDIEPRKSNLEGNGQQLNNRTYIVFCHLSVPRREQLVAGRLRPLVAAVGPRQLGVRQRPAAAGATVGGQQLAADVAACGRVASCLARAGCHQCQHRHRASCPSASTWASRPASSGSRGVRRQCSGSCPVRGAAPVAADAVAERKRRSPQWWCVAAVWQRQQAVASD